jgi:serine/threonine-protein kinase
LTDPFAQHPDLPQAQRIDAICTDFEAAWQTSEPPHLEDWLHEIPDGDWLTLLQELILLEVYYRQQRGAAVGAAEYRQRFPELDEAWLNQAIAARPKATDSSQATPDDGAVTCQAATATIRYYGDYELGEEIGRGGMGVVYRGHDPDLDRMLAVKVLLEEHRDNEQLVRRFLEEAHIMGQLQHPGVAPIHELGRLADGRPFFSMRQIQGQTLAELLKDREPGTENRFSVTDLRFLGIFEQVCQTMAFAHSRGIIHRDLKPGNIMVGAFGEVQVMDWGLAKEMKNEEIRRGGDEENESVAHCRLSSSPHPLIPSSPPSEETAVGSVLGTPAYMAPEQARGEVDHLDERCDVFGLGAILCEILTGRPAFPGDTQVDSHRRAMKGDLQETFARLEDCGADPELVQLAQRCLAADKEDRPRQAAAVSATVAQYQAGVRERLRQAEIDRASARVKAAEERRRLLVEKQKRRITMILVALAAIFLLAATGVGMWHHQDRLARNVRREQLEQVLEAHLAEMEGQRQALRKTLANPLTASAWLSDLQQWQAQVARTRAHWQRAKLLADGGQDLLDDSWFARLELLNQQISADEEDSQWARKLDDVSVKAFTLVEGKWDFRGIAAREFPPLFRQMGLDAENGAEVEVAAQIRRKPIRYALVAALDHWASAFPDKSKLRPRLLEIARRADPDPWRNQVRQVSMGSARSKVLQLLKEARLEQQTPQIIDRLAWIVRAFEGKGEAAALVHKALVHHPNNFWLHLTLAGVAGDRGEEIAGYRAALAVRPGSAVVHSNLGAALRAQKELNAAIEHYHKAIALDPDFAAAHLNLGLALKDKKDLDGAIAHWQKAIAIRPDYARAHCNLGVALAHKKDLDGAIAHLQKAIALDPDVALAHFNLGLALRLKKDLDGAIVSYQKAIALDPNDATAHNNLANILESRQDLDSAIQHYQKAIAIRPDYAYAHYNLGHTLVRQGKFAEALKSLQKGHALGSRQPGWPGAASAQVIKRCERLLELDQKLPALLKGAAQPTGAAEQAEFAALCLRYKKYYRAAAQFYAAALEAAPALGGQHRYDAACAAVLAAAGRGQDADQLQEGEPAQLRRQALDWLRQELAGLKTQLTASALAAATACTTLEQWQTNAKLDSVRQAQELTKLPEAERQQWQGFWAEVATLLAQAKKR